MAFLGSQLLTKEVFIANSPTIRPNLGPYMATRLQNVFSNTSQSLALLFYKSPAEELKNLPLIPVAKGVYAKSNDKASYTEYRVNEVEWIEYTFTVKGKEIKISVPKGQDPPPQNILEDLQ